MKKAVIFILSFIIVSLLNYDFSITSSIIPNAIFSLLLSYFLNNEYQKYQQAKTKINKIALINSILFSLFFIIGICYEKEGSLSYLFNIKNLLLSIANLTIFTIIFYCLISFLYTKIDNIKETKANNKVINFIFNKHPFLSSFIIVLLSSFIYIIFFYPGIMAWDGLWQLDYYYGIFRFTNHHPAGVSLIMGKLMDIGSQILNDNLGMFLFILIQVIANALIYGYVIKIMDKMNVPLIIKILSLFFYSTYSYLVVYSVTYVKDTIFYLFLTLLFVYTYYHFHINYQEKNILKYLILALIYFILFIFRNNGFHVILITSIIMLITNIKRDKYIVTGYIILLLFTITLNYSYHNIFLVNMSIEEGSRGEALSIPLQQVARYVNTYPDDITREEDTHLRRIFGDEYKDYLKDYNPHISDKVKAKFINNPTTDYQWEHFFKAWYSLFFKHPGVYIDATLNNIYGYFFPVRQLFTSNTVITYEIKKDKAVDFGNLDLNHNEKLAWGRKILRESSEYVKKQPVINLLYTSGFYDLILIFAIFNLIHQKRAKEIVYLTPLILILAVCIASPVNGYFRYTLPIVASTPFLIALLCTHFKIPKQKAKKL